MTTGRINQVDIQKQKEDKKIVLNTFQTKSSANSFVSSPSAQPERNTHRRENTFTAILKGKDHQQIRTSLKVFI
jgi:hypothetical protein